MRLLYTLSCVLFLVSRVCSERYFGFVCPPTVRCRGPRAHNPSPHFSRR